MLRHATEPFRVSGQWRGSVELDRYDLPRRGLINQQKNFGVVWKEWCTGAPPYIDFDKEMVFFLKGDGAGNTMFGCPRPNEQEFQVYADGAVKLNFGMTCVYCSGFNCLLLRTSRLNKVISLNGEAAVVIDLENASPNNKINEPQEKPFRVP